MKFKLPSRLLPSIAIIPARSGSKGVPGKNLRILGGQTLIERAVKCAQECQVFSKIIVSSDGATHLAEASRLGVRPISRPKKLSLDGSNIVDTITHILAILSQEGFSPATVVLLEPSCPLRNSEIVMNTLKKLGHHESAFTVSEVDLKFHPAKQFSLSEAGVALRACINLVPPVNRQELSKTVIQNGAAYAFHASMFKRENSVLGPEPKAVMVTQQLVNIDTLEDFALAERIIERN